MRALADRLGATPYTVHTAAFAALLHRYTGQDDLVLGVFGAGSDDPAGHPLVLRADVSGDPPFAELAARLAATAEEAAAHAGLSPAELAEAVGEDPDPSRAPLFQAALAFGPTEGGDDHQGDDGPPPVDLRLRLTDAAGGTEVTAGYDADLFDPATVEQLVRHYGRLLTAALADPGRRVAEIDLLDETERRHLLHDCDGPRRERPDTTVVELIARQVAQRPDAVAVVAGERELTYAELDARADELAAPLRAAGAGPGALVAVCLPRTADLVATLLAVLRTGAGYIPLDPAHPAGRIATVLADSEAVATVCVQATADAVRDAGRPLLPLDRPEDWPAAAPGQAAATATPDDTAYVLYTSGSTGTPKGVRIGHRALANFLASVTELFELTDQDRVLGFAAVTFDVSVFETFSALANGARLVLVPDETRSDLDRLQEVLQRHRITVVDLPPSLMELLDPDRLPELRIVFVGGEAFPGELVNRWSPGRRFFNGYGPTECTVTMIVQECRGDWHSSPPIGLPMANHVAHVLDRHGRLVPPGVAGELVIGGLGLADEYLSRPELTAEKFYPDPFGTAPGGRLYRTGDLVRRDRDDALVFLGRIDKQVKIRGLRIELGEVEAALGKVPGVRQATVQPWTDPSGGRHLVGYVTLDDGRALGEDELREGVAAHVPSYMVPTYFTVLDAFPLMPSGKVNAKELPAPRADAGPAACAPSYANETEEALAREVIAPVLRREAVGPDEDFFALGGHSLAAAQVVSRLRRHFGVEFSLADFAPTVRALAPRVRLAQARQLDDSGLRELVTALTDEEAAALLAAATGDDQPRPAGRTSARDALLDHLSRPRDDAGGFAPARLRPGRAAVGLVLVHPVGGALLCYGPLTEALAPGAPVYGFAAEDARDNPAEDGGVPAVAERYLTALPGPGRPERWVYAGWSFGGAVAYEMARRSGPDAVAVLLDSDFPGTAPAYSEPGLRRFFVHDLCRSAGADEAALAALDRAAGEYDTLPFAALRSAAGLDEGFTDAEIEDRYRLCAANMRALDDFRPKPHPGPVHFVRAGLSEDAGPAWSEVASALRATTLDGADHYTLVTPAYASQVAAVLDRALGDAGRP
ncbi:non-ribosomal peptide synthetase [Streptomyces solincola]|uniref:Non-ribosomal peptide synthetase n=2 Tax=Streptomyces solincola TaxID=2100817 RepID=A0A2S9PX46_9ACTN|nr:non-ribosomal peptide synthetase [Streptomyces solincola]